MTADPPPPTSLTERLLSDAEATAWLRSHLGGRPVSAQRVQSLWSGYGEIARVHLEGASRDRVIVKWVAPPAAMRHPRGWSGRASHERKVRSYDVERCFYADWVPRPASSHRTAECLAAEATAGGWRFLLEDLDEAGFAGRHQELSAAQLERCLRWLASFHARFLGRDPAGLWETGTYWHLATRPDELAALRDAQLRAAAEPLDALLGGCAYQTLVHGDAKVANFCFGADDVAAVDFQYVGGGCGMKDVAYFLSSCLTDTECERQAPRHLDTYFRLLRERLDAGVDADALEREWRALYPAAWADFHRFLAGWAPDHWKIHRYTREMTRQALAAL